MRDLIERGFFVVLGCAVSLSMMVIGCDQPSDSPTSTDGAGSEAGEPQASEPQAGEPQAGEPQAGEPQAGEPQAGEPQAGEPQAGEPQAGEPQAETLTLSPLELWATPTQTYIDEATAAIGDQIDRAIHDLTVFRGALYVGYGDADLNAGGVSPIAIMSCASPEVGCVEDPLETGEEGIYGFRHIDGELMIAGTDSTDADELTSRPLIEGNFLRTRDGVWEKHRAIQGGEHVHDVASFYGNLWAVGSGADNRTEWEMYGVYRYLWLSRDGGVTWRRHKRVFREERGDTRFVHLIAVGPYLYVFGYVNPSSSERPTYPVNESLFGPNGEPIPLITGREEGQTETDAHPLADVFVEKTYPITEELGVISGFDIANRRWRMWMLTGAGEITPLDSFGDRRLIDLYVDQERETLTMLLHDDNNREGASGVIMHASSFGALSEPTEILELTALTWDEGQAPRSIAHWGDSIYVGRESGEIWRGVLSAE